MECLIALFFLVADLGSLMRLDDELDESVGDRGIKCASFLVVCRIYPE